jgi:alkylation response protein AidB-like acyl-CoA dehydrogenase
MMRWQARTPGGERFVELAEGHVDAFRKRADEHDRESTFPLENIEDLKQSGVLGAFVPGDLGGLGVASVHDWALGLERLGRADPSTAIALNMHLGMSRNLSLAWQRAEPGPGKESSAGMLRAIAGGQLVICATATEAGTDFLRPLTTATRAEGGTWSLSGRKIFVTLSPAANVIAMNARICEEGEPDRIGFAFVPVGSAGVAFQDDWDALGMRASGSQSLVLEDVRVPDGTLQIAGEWGRWNAGLLMGRTLANLTLTSVFLGIAERARELAVEGARTQTKPKFGGVLAQSSGVQHLLGEIDIDLAAARSILVQTTLRLDALLEELGDELPELDVAHECMRDYQCAKWVVNQNAIRIVSRAMDVTGGGAYMSRNELSRLYRDVRAGPFMQPFSPTEAREYVGRIALGLPPEG